MFGTKVVPEVFTMTDIIKKTGVRDVVGPYNVGSDFYEAFDDRVAELVEDAVERARANGRRTVQAKDV